MIPALERYKPQLILIASGLDANGVDPLARLIAHSETFRFMAHALMDVADRTCGGVRGECEYSERGNRHSPEPTNCWDHLGFGPLMLTFMRPDLPGPRDASE